MKFTVTITSRLTHSHGTVDTPFKVVAANEAEARKLGREKWDALMVDELFGRELHTLGPITRQHALNQAQRLFVRSTIQNGH